MTQRSDVSQKMRQERPDDNPLERSALIVLYAD